MGNSLEYSQPWIDHRASRLWGVVTELSNNLSNLKKSSYGVLQSLNLKDFGLLEEEFEPQGITLVWGLKTSHMAIHTWPERDYQFMHIDALTCGGPEFSLNRLHDTLKAVYLPKRIITQEIIYTPPEEVLETDETSKWYYGVQVD